AARVSTKTTSRGSASHSQAERGAAQRRRARRSAVSASSDRRPEIDQDPHEPQALRKAAVWSLVAGLAHLAAPEFAPGFYPSWYFALGALGYGLLLLVIASLHARHEPGGRSRAVPGTVPGATGVSLGPGAARGRAVMQRER